MQISSEDWLNYVKKMRKLSDTAANKLQEYVNIHGFENTDYLIEYAHALVTRYGEGAAELSCELYDSIAELAGANVPSAIPAATATYRETANAIEGSLNQSPTGAKLYQVVDRLVKQAGADTTMQNAIRDGAQWAWIPIGDTCAFCITLASRGWQYASKKVLKGNHASHVHSHCDCQFAVRFNQKDGINGYNPEEYKDLYNSFSGSPNSKINAIRRMKYEENKDRINAQKREAYAKRKNNEK